MISNPKKYKLEVYIGDGEFQVISPSSLNIMENYLIVDGSYKIPIYRIRKIINTSSGSIVIEQPLVFLTSGKYLSDAKQVSDKDSYIKYMSEDGVKYMDLLEFLRKSKVFYKPGGDDNDLEILTPLKILLALYGESLPVDTIIQEIYNEKRFSRDIKFKVLGELSELRGLGLVDYVIYDETDREGSYYTLTEYGKDWVTNQAVEIFEDIMPLISVIHKNNGIDKRHFFVKVATMKTDIDEFFFISALFKNNPVTAYEQYLNKIKGISFEKIKKQATNEQIGDIIKKLINENLLSFQNDSISVTEHGKELMSRLTYEVMIVLRKLQIYKMITIENDILHLTNLGRNAVSAYIKNIEKSVSIKPSVILELPRYDSLSFTLKTVTKKIFKSWTNFLLVLTLGIIVLAIVSSALGLGIITIILTVLIIILGIIMFYLSNKKWKLFKKTS